MCYIVGSLQQATSTCPMCKVFKPSASRCPHIKEVCRNSANHPRHDVMFLKNAEVQTFQGCGYCKWAKTSPPPTRAGYQNPGWPGCCRPPNAQEQKYIGAADWPAVSFVHHVPIPADIKTILDGLYPGPTPPRGTPPLGSPPGSVRGGNLQSAAAAAASAPGISRRSSYNIASPTRTEASSTTRSNAVAIPTKGRSGSGGSPQQMNVSLSPRGGGGPDGTPSSLPNASSMEQYQSSRRTAMDVFADKRPDPVNTSQSSPGRKPAELTGTVTRRSSEQRRPSISSITSPAPSSKGTADPALQRRRTAPSTTNGTNPLCNPSQDKTPVRPAERPGPERPTETAQPRRGSTIEEAVVEKVEKMSLSSSASSSSSGSSSETTVISDGGFTDYLSDESEAELQRQAEAKAAIVAQNQMEELEFRAARQQLADVDLRPPKSWRGEVQSTPRSQVPNRNSTSYARPTFASAPAYAASTASTHSRG